MFRNAFKKRPALIAASGFFEWTGPKEDKQPWFISAADGKPLTFAGLHETWKNRETDDIVESCTIITTAANEFVKKIHDRMPVILAPSDWDEWLQSPNLDVLKQAPEDALQAWRVAKNVNKNDYRGTDAAAQIADE